MGLERLPTWPVRLSSRQCATVHPQQKGVFDVGQAALRDQTGFLTCHYLFYFEAVLFS